METPRDTEAFPQNTRRAPTFGMGGLQNRARQFNSARRLERKPQVRERFRCWIAGMGGRAVASQSLNSQNEAFAAARNLARRAWASTTVFALLVLVLLAAVVYAAGARAAREAYVRQAEAQNGRYQLVQNCVENVVLAPAGDGAGGPADEGHPMAYCLLPLLQP